MLNERLQREWRELVIHKLERNEDNLDAISKDMRAEMAALRIDVNEVKERMATSTDLKDVVERVRMIELFKSKAVGIFAAAQVAVTALLALIARTWSG